MPTRPLARPALLTALPALTALVAFAGKASAEFPLESMGPHRLGLQYGLGFRGQDITAKDIPSHEVIHALTLGYAPLPYVGVEAGMGLDRFSVDGYNGTRFEGSYGLSPVFGLMAASPALLDLVRLNGGARFLYLDSEDDRGFAYSGFIVSPYLSAGVHPSGYFSAQAGARGHYIDGTMTGPGGRESNFANRETVRGFVSFTVKSPSDLAFLTLDADFSPAFDSDWAKGPRESSVGISFGTLLGWKTKSPPDTKGTPPYFPAYPDLKERQKKMAEELE